MWQFEGLRQLIEQSDIITIFRHEHPDCDAVGSQYGLKNWIKDNWPSKRVYALGNEYCTQGDCWPECDSCTEMEIRSSIAIVLDTANTERIDDDRYALAKQVIKIDHHPNHFPYGDIAYVYVNSASTCEILAEFFRQCADTLVTTKTAEYLFRGILTDTLSFRTTNTGMHTLESAGWLAQFGVRIPDLNRELFDQSMESFQFGNLLRSSIQIRDRRLAYRIVSIQEMKEWDMTVSETKNFIEEFGHVKEFEIYCIFCEKVVDNLTLYDGSLRSKHVVINDIAEEYHGGGHATACGVKNLTKHELNDRLDELYVRSRP